MRKGIRSIKRGTAVLLSACMVFGMTPIQAGAEETGISVSGNETQAEPLESGSDEQTEGSASGNETQTQVEPSGFGSDEQAEGSASGNETQTQMELSGFGSDAQTQAGAEENDSEIAVQANDSAGRTEQQSTDEASVTINGETLYYATLEEAFSAADGKTATINMLDDAECINYAGAPFCVDSGESDITLKMNGKTLSGLGKENCGTITVKEGSLAIQGPGRILSIHKVLSCESNARNIAVENVTFDLNSCDYGIWVDSMYPVILDNVQVCGWAYKGAVYINNSDANVTINNMSAPEYGRCDVVYNGGTLKINGGTFDKISDCVYRTSVSNVLGEGCIYRNNEDKTWVTSDLSNTYEISNVTVEKIPLTINPEAETSWYYNSAEHSLQMNAEPTTAGNEITYEWYNGDTKLECTSDAYTIPKTMPTGSYTYTCKATCDGYTLSHDFTFTVEECKHEGVEITFNSNGFGNCPKCNATVYQPAVETNDKYDIDDDGTKDTVYEISNAGQLYWFADKVNNDNATYGSANAVLTEDIVVNENLLDSLDYDADGKVTNGESFIGWACIGWAGWVGQDSVSNQYNGTFDGQNHTVSGLYFNDAGKYNFGLFGVVHNDGSVSNVGVVDSCFYCYGDVGGVCGISYGTISNCYNTGRVSGNNANVGGVCGTSYGTITNCYNTGAVSSNSSRVGGVCGDNNEKISNCYNTGTVSGATAVGGVSGRNVNIITNCYNVGTVRATDNNPNVGGVCGYCWGSKTIESYCYYLDTCAADGTTFNITSGESMTASQFASGEVTYLLNGSKSEGDTVHFYQNLSGENADALPVLDKSAIAMLFATAAVLPEKLPVGVGITANAENSEIVESNSWLEVSCAENNYKTIDYTSSDENTYTCYVYSSTEYSAVLISVNGWSHVANNGVLGYDNQVADLASKGARMPKFAELQILLDAGMNLTKFDNFNCQEYEVAWVENGKWRGQKGNNKYADSTYHAVFEINRNPIETVSDSIFKTDSSPTLSAVKGEDFTWQGNCDIEISYYNSDKTICDSAPAAAGDYYVKVSTPTIEADEDGNTVRYEASESDYIPFTIVHNFPDTFDSNGFKNCPKCNATVYQPATETTDKYDIDDDGTKEAVYEISNAGQLYWFAGLVNGDKEVCTGDVTQDLSAKAVLTADITVNTGVLNADGTLQADTENLRSWTPVGSNTGTEENAANGYSGTFDGQNHTISGLYFDDANADAVGLFGYITENSQVFCVGITDSYFNGRNYVGAVCGKNDGIIRNCYNTGTVSGSQYVGGVNGYNSAKVANCYNIGTIHAKTAYNADGVAYSASGETHNSYYLAGCAASGTRFTDYHPNESKTAEQFACGEVAYLLSQGYTYQWNDQDCESYDGSAWGQDLSREASWPVLDVTKKVYCGYKDCSGKTYANEPLSETPNHKEFDANGFCTVCGGYQPAVKNAKGIYEIGNVGQLYWFAGLVNGTLGYIDQDRLADAVLTKDITVNSNVLNPDGTLAQNADSLRSWTPIGSDYNNQYTGTFDGQNHTISGLYLDNPDKASVGLFGSIGSDYNNGNNKCARISNVNLVDSYFNAGSNVGGVCGQSAYLTSIENCRNAGTVKGDSYVGGICGDNSGTIQICINTGAVSGTGSSIGGISGQTSRIIVNCYNTGAVSGIRYSVGGVCGSVDYGTIINSYNTGVVSGSESDEYSSIGGVCGQYSNGNIVNCYYLAGCAAEGTTFNNTEGERTKEQFASGEIAYLLDQEYKDIAYQITYDGAVWGQKLGKGGDNYPVFSENKVYRNETYKGCTGNPGEPDVVYSNTKADPVYAEHTDTDNDGKCDSCGKQYTVVTVSCNPSNSGILDGGGKYELGDQIILNARAVDGFVFVGWYDKEQITESDQPLSKETTYNYGTVDEQTPSEISLYAVYKSNETRQLSMTLGSGKVEYSYQNGTKTGTWSNDFTNNNYARGTYFTVTAKPNEGYTFLYWINSDGRVLTDSLTYSFYLGDNMKLQACYKSTQGSETETEKHYVIFKDSDGKILWSGDVSMDQAEGNDKYGLVNVPQHGIFNGVTFKNWRDASGNVLSTEETGSIKVTEDMIIYAEYEAISGLTLTVDGVQSDKTYTYGSLVTATAEESKDGKYFSGWYVGDKLVSDKREYSFRITENTAIEAKYDGEDVITQQPLLNMTMSERTTLSNGYQTVVMNVSWSVPEGYEFVDAGIVRTLTDAYKDKLTLSDVDNTNVKKNPTKLTTADGTMVYTLTLSTASVSKNVYAKGYMTYKNTSTGEVNTLYTDAYTSNAAK